MPACSWGSSIPDGFAGGEMSLDVELARRAFEALPTPLGFDDRVGYAYRIAVANIAEEMTNVAVRHGVDPRDFTLVAYGAAGPMLLPAALELLRARRVVVPPHPGLFSAIGLLSTDLVFYESRSSYVVLTPAAAPSIAEVYEQMEARLRSSVPAGTPVTVRRSFDGRLMGQSWETPFVELPEGPIDEAMIGTMVALFHEQYERRYGNRFEFVPVQGVTYRVQLIAPSEKVDYVAGEPGDGGTVVARPDARAALLRRDRSRGRRVPAREPAGRRAHHRPGDHPRRPLDDVRLPWATGRDRPVRRDRDRAGGGMTDAKAAPLRELGDAEFAALYGCDRFTATVLTNRFGYIVEHMCVRLLTAAFSPILRDFYDFAATLTAPAQVDWVTPAMSNSIMLFTGTMADSVRNVVSEYGVDKLGPGDIIVANDPYRTGTHVNDVLFCKPVFHDGELVSFVNLKAHQLDMGGSVPGGFSVSKRTVYENGLVLSPRPLFKAGKPVQETWSLIFDNVRFGEILHPDMQTVCAELDLGERLLLETVERYGDRRRPRVDAVRLRRRRRADQRGDRGDAGRHLDGRGDRRLRRRRRHGGVPSSAPA